MQQLVPTLTPSRARTPPLRQVRRSPLSCPHPTPHPPLRQVTGDELASVARRPQKCDTALSRNYDFKRHADPPKKTKTRCATESVIALRDQVSSRSRARAGEAEASRQFAGQRPP